MHHVSSSVLNARGAFVWLMPEWSRGAAYAEILGTRLMPLRMVLSELSIASVVARMIARPWFMLHGPSFLFHAAVIVGIPDCELAVAGVWVHGLG